MRRREFLGKKNWPLSYFKNWKFCAYFFRGGWQTKGKVRTWECWPIAYSGALRNIHDIDIQAPCNNIDVDYTLTVSHGDQTDSLIWVSLNFSLGKIGQNPTRQIGRVETGIGL